MSSKRKPPGYWRDKSNVLADAVQYQSRTEWCRASGSAYSAALKMGIIDEACAGMVEKQKPSGYWTRERVNCDAKKHDTRSEWKSASPVAYLTACKGGYLDQATAHMVRLKREDGYWTRERVMADARQYNKRVAWRKLNGAAVNAATRGGYYEEATQHMPGPIRPANYWTRERVLVNAEQYDSISRWMRDNRSAYNAARKGHYWDLAIKHMKTLKKPAGFWTRDKVIADAAKYKTRSEWIKANQSAYQVAKRGEILEEACEHMVEVIKPPGYWTKERVLANAQMYNGRKAWTIASKGAYSAACDGGYLEEASGHMVHVKTPSDSVYIWDTGQPFNGKSVYKIGITGEAQGEKRIRQLAKSSGFDCEIILLQRVVVSARLLEAELLTLGDDPKFVGDGSTEFRALTNDELDLACELISECAVES